ncbi:uncharacterized protein LOC143367911 [Andrena cerasifolii]|uniref:uncharacterized protein LOC143367911 n=1 Tax=Andrena cerasifolii TaxID=2819439 RepID=UPI00403819F5
MLPDRMDGPAYKVFLEHVLPDLMNHIPNEIRRNMFYQQDGAGPHYATIARDYLNQTFQDRWIGRGGPVAWPPRSPDMTPLDFFFWGYLKDEVYRQPVDTLEDIVVRIHAAVANITPQTLLAVQRVGDVSHSERETGSRHSATLLTVHLNTVFREHVANTRF